MSRSDGKAPDAKEPIKPAQDTAPKETAAAEQTAPEPTTPPRPVEEGKLVYLKLSEVHPFHTFRPHPFKVRDDAKMQEIVASIRVNGVMEMCIRDRQMSDCITCCTRTARNKGYARM